MFNENGSVGLTLSTHSTATGTHIIIIFPTVQIEKQNLPLGVDATVEEPKYIQHFLHEAKCRLIWQNS